MKKIIGCMFLFLAAAVSADVWIPSGDIVSITQIVQWENNSNVVFELSSGYRCHITSDEDKVFSTALALYFSGKTASIHCHQAEENIGGYLSHRLHRIVTM